MNEPIEQHRCVHLRMGTLGKHATLRVDTVPPAENTTSYDWRIEIELCVLCSGFARARVEMLCEAPPLMAAEYD